jgi:iron(III) transport system substrate-binding protein
LDPQYKGKIVMSDPRNIPAWIIFYNMFLNDPDYGPEFLEALGDQEPVIVQSAIPGSEQVAAGQGGTVVFPTVDLVTKPLVDKGAPVEAVNISPTTGIATTMIMSANAPHPKATRCFLNWVATEEGQVAYNGGGRASSPLGDLEGTLPLPDDYVAGDPAEAEANRDEILQLLGLA